MMVGFGSLGIVCIAAVLGLVVYVLTSLARGGGRGQNAQGAGHISEGWNPYTDSGMPPTRSSETTVSEARAESLSDAASQINLVDTVSSNETGGYDSGSSDSGSSDSGSSDSSSSD